MYTLTLVDIGVYVWGWLTGAYGRPAEFVAIGQTARMGRAKDRDPPGQGFGGQ